MRVCWPIGLIVLVCLLSTGNASAATCPDGSAAQTITSATANARTPGNDIDDNGHTVGTPTALVNQSFEVFAEWPDTLYSDPATVWTAQLRGSDHTVTKEDPPSAAFDRPKAQVSLDQVGTWDLGAAISYISCQGYSDSLGHLFPEVKASYQTATIPVKIIEPQPGKTVGHLDRPKRSDGFGDPKHEVPTRAQIITSRLLVEVRCAEEALAPSAPLVWKAYVSYSGKRPKGQGKPTYSWSSRPTGCVTPADGSASDPWGKSQLRKCPPIGFICWEIDGDRATATIRLYKSGRLLLQLFQGERLIAANRLRFRAYRNLPNPSRYADGPFTFISVSNDGRCEGMAGGRCSSYKRD